VTDAGACKEVKRGSELLGLTNLLVGLDSFQTGELYMSAQVEKKVHSTRQAKLRTLALSNQSFLTGN
jgi:hypothetical protein